ncbi:MAG: hypothetical protein HRT87_05195 [Legionellales bacterium]|nr:hypothetical protein [Legionellales bacterium]
MIQPEAIALLGILFSSFIFYICARGVNQEKLTLDGFMLADRSLNKSKFSNTFAASSFSLALNTMFLFVNCQNYAVFMLIAPITYMLGHYACVALIRKSNVDVNDCRTVSDLCYKFFPSKAVARLISLITLTSYVMLVFIELYIGSMVLTFFLPKNIFCQTLSFICIGVIVLLYVRLGGYKALVKTDKWQLGLMVLATGLIAVYALFTPTVNQATTETIINSMLTPEFSMGEVVTFVIWLSVLNMLKPFSQISNWQRVTATQNTTISCRGLIHSSKYILTLFLLTLFGFMLLKAKGYELGTLVEFLKLVKTSDSISAYCIFPLMIVGFCSMVFSSADVAIISIVYTLADKNSFKEKFNRMNENKLRRTLTLLISTILVLLSIIYWLQFTVLHEWLLPLTYVVCGQIAILTPIPVYILLKLRKQENFTSIEASKKNIFILFNSILISWVLFLVCAYIAKTTSQQFWSQISVPVGALIILFGIHRVNSYFKNMRSTVKVTL